MKIRTWFLALSLILLLGYGLVAVGTEAQTGGCSTTHIVQRGETLYRIALRYNTTVADLQARNSISNPNRITVGQQLCISGGFVPPTTPVPNNPPANYGTVTAWFLNVRSGPGTQYPVLRLVRRGETFPVTGRNVSSTWYQITTDPVFGVSGWVSATYFTAPNPQNLPVVNNSAAPYSGYFVLNADATVYSTANGSQTVDPHQIFAGMTVRIIGRNSASTMFEIATDNGTGWLRQDVFPADFPRNAFAVTG
jgi:LysM repeat protein